MKKGIGKNRTHAAKLNLKNLKHHGSSLMGGVQLFEGYRATTTRQFTFNHSVPRSSWYSFDQPQNNRRLNQHWRPLDW